MSDLGMYGQLAHAAIRRHRADARALTRVVADFKRQLKNATTDEQRAGLGEVIATLRAHIAQLDLPLERERAP
jgi:hypothetical protein